MKNTEIHTKFRIRMRFSLCMLVSAAMLHAQDFVDVFRLSYTQGSKAKFVGDSGTNKTNLNELSLDVNTPIKLNNKYSIITGLNYEYFRTSLDIAENKKSIYSIGLKVGVNTVITNKWTINAILIPKFASDVSAIGSEDFQIGLYSLAKYRKSNQLQYKFGFYANKEFFGPWLVPIIGFYYLSNNNKLELNTNLPISVEANYTICSHWYTGIYYSGLTKSYLINDAYLVRSGSDISAALKYKISQNLYIQGRFGRSIGRKYKLFNGEDQVDLGSPFGYVGDDRTILNHLFKDAWLYQLQFFLRIPTNKNK